MASPEVVIRCGERTCKDCEQALPLYSFNSYISRGKRRFATICKSCHAKRYSSMISQSEANAAIRKVRELKALIVDSKQCSRCNEKLPARMFPDGRDGGSVMRTCYRCRVELLQLKVEALAERASLVSDREWGRHVQRRYVYANPEKAIGWDNTRRTRMEQSSDGTLTVESIGELFARAEGRGCPYCGVTLNRHNKSMDHVIPLASGGSHGISNVIICCKKCNTKKGSRSARECFSGIALSQDYMQPRLI